MFTYPCASGNNRKKLSSVPLPHSWGAAKTSPNFSVETRTCPVLCCSHHPTSSSSPCRDPGDALRNSLSCMMPPPDFPVWGVTLLLTLFTFWIHPHFVDLKVQPEGSPMKRFRGFLRYSCNKSFTPTPSSRGLDIRRNAQGGRKNHFH